MVFEEQELLLPAGDEAQPLAKPAHEIAWRDRFSIALLLLLYMMQGIPMGLCASIPLILMERGR